MTPHNVVDMEQIRKMKNARPKSVEKAVQTKKMKKEIVQLFLDVYQEECGMPFKLRPARFRRTKKKTIRIDPDAQRIWMLYKKLVKDYSVDSDGFKEYLHDIIQTAINTNYVDTPASMFGFVVSDTVVENYFFKKNKSSKSISNKANQKMNRMADKYAKLLNI